MSATDPGLLAEIGAALGGVDPVAMLVAATDEVFLGWWPADLMDIVRRPYEPGALAAYAQRGSGS
ncbi:hypothetical protein [Streptomyces sp. SAJ15]|uniref:hypothetical protein n=1 Tax=Streptomyces sp. SAJ15 TaxID=2011095 RepID=UPI001184BD17|nr:hypothetical protein [Streptomyces sp. SAJ15]TVL89779.1 hypothetical protein CD790_25620 [Streptomyces sp. SAJ15]